MDRSCQQQIVFSSEAFTEQNVRSCSRNTNMIRNCDDPVSSADYQGFRNEVKLCVRASLIFSYHGFIRKVMEAVQNGFEKMSIRLDSLESSLRLTLRDSRADMSTNTKELGMLSALVRNACLPGIRESSHLFSENACEEDASSGEATHVAQQDQKVSVESQVLLRRLKRGCLLQYERDDDDDEEDDGNTRAPSSTANIFEHFKRHVSCPEHSNASKFTALEQAGGYLPLI
jgi:hypothetical protein